MPAQLPPVSQSQPPPQAQQQMVMPNQQQQQAMYPHQPQQTLTQQTSQTPMAAVQSMHNLMNPPVSQPSAPTTATMMAEAIVKGIVEDGSTGSSSTLETAPPSEDGDRSAQNFSLPLECMKVLPDLAILLSLRRPKTFSSDISECRN